ncbi:MAG: H(+)/Cl(-) exchange transporter ClcA [Candidatus Sumerlaeaceae bacterium]
MTEKTESQKDAGLVPDSFSASPPPDSPKDNTRPGDSSDALKRIQKELQASAAPRGAFLGSSGLRHQLWRAALVGIGAGITAILFQKGLEGAEWLREVMISAHITQGLRGHLLSIVYCAGLVWVAKWLTSRYCPQVAGSGIPHVKAVLAGFQRLHWSRILPIKLLGGICAIGGGLSLGREGPTVHMGASVGAALGSALRLPQRAQRTLIAAGAGAGLAAAFNAPLAGFLFVLEELEKSFTPVTYATALVASTCADVVTRLVIGERPAFRIVGFPAPPLQAFPLVLTLGILAGLVGILFSKALLASVRAARIPSRSRTLLVGILAGVVSLYLPAVAGGGHYTAEIVLRGTYLYQGGLVIMLALMVAKFGMTMISYASGVPGGIFAPMLVIGAFLGLSFGAVALRLPPAWSVAPQAFAILGMAAVLASVTRAPVTGVVLILEMTNNYEQLFALMVACGAAYLVAKAFRVPPIYDALLELDLERQLPQRAIAPSPTIYELIIERGSYLEGLEVQEVPLPPGCAIVSLLRGNAEIVPPPALHIQAGDVLVVVAESRDPHAGYLLQRMARVE